VIVVGLVLVFVIFVGSGVWGVGCLFAGGDVAELSGCLYERGVELWVGLWCMC